MKTNENRTEQHKLTANHGYGLGQIAKALTTATEHADAATRERAQQRIQKWEQVISGMLQGDLTVGSRTPVKGTPAWATLEVITGGFATGNLMAEGPILPHETAWIEKLGAPREANVRSFLNHYFLTESGLAELTELLNSGRYEVQIPEEGALLTMAWLLQEGKAQKARELLQVISPWFSRLRFYPVPLEVPRKSGSQVFLQSVGETSEKLAGMKENKAILAQKETIEVWLPFYDRLVALFLKTVEGPVPTLKRDADGVWRRGPQGKFPIVGGWPCQVYGEAWMKAARQMMTEYEALCAAHQHSSKPDHHRSGLAQLLEALLHILNNPASLTGKDVGRIRLVLARYVARHGVPQSAELTALRERQRQQTAGPIFREIAQILVQRLNQYPAEEGLDNLEPVLSKVSETEARLSAVKAETVIPKPLQKKVSRCLREEIEVLVQRGLITSGESLARVLPQITAEIRAAGIEDPMLRRLYASIYRAFRRRRSLLLLSLESQVKIEELPWVNAIDGMRKANLSLKKIAAQTLKEVLMLTLRSFPQAILPNKLLQELRALIKTAGYRLPMVDELAVDIFMGSFSMKFVHSATEAAKLLEGTLYTQYYGIDTQAVIQMAEEKKVKRLWGTPTSEAFLKMCEKRAGVKAGTWQTAINGMIIEQEQILTTHNLGPLFRTFELAQSMEQDLPGMARSCFQWICKRMQVKTPSWHADLIKIKNSAYAWRQMVFFLSLVSPEEQQAFFGWAKQQLAGQTEAFRKRFAPALDALEQAAKEVKAGVRGDYKVFLGWTKSKHWLMDR